jgi:hypothetical protein
MMFGRVQHDAFAKSGKALDPELGWTNPPGETYLENTVTHATSQHLRGTRLYPLEKPPGVTRIEVFGDSFAFGSEVDDDSCYAAQLEKRLPSAEVLDFGVPGYGLDQAFLRFRKEGPAFHPDVVVIGYVSALPGRDTEPFTFFYKPYFVLREGQLVLRGTPVPGFADALTAYAHSSRIVDVWRILVHSDRTDEALERALLAEFVKQIRASGARPVLVRYPIPMEFGRQSPISQLYADACVATGATCVDTKPAFDDAHARGVELSAPRAVHFNAAGHGIVAEALAEALRR